MVVLCGVFFTDGQSSCFEVQFEQALKRPGSFPALHRIPAAPPEQHPPCSSLPVQIPLCTALRGIWGYSSPLKTCLAICMIRAWGVKLQGREVTSVAVFLQMPAWMFRKQGCNIFYQAPVFWGHLGPPCHFAFDSAPCPHLQEGDYLYRQHFEAGSSYLMLAVTPRGIKGDAIPESYAYSPLFAGPKSWLRCFFLAREGEEKNRNKIWTKTFWSSWKIKTLESRSRNKLYHWHLFTFLTNEMQSSDRNTRFKTLKS